MHILRGLYEVFYYNLLIFYIFYVLTKINDSLILALYNA
jgi:hypothetical protein